MGDPHTIANPGLRHVLDVSAGVKPPYTAERLAKVTTLEWYEDGVAPGKSFTRLASLQGVEHCVNLRVAELGDNHLTNLAPLAGLAALEELGIRGNDIDDLTPLRGKLRLRRLSAGDNVRLRDLGPLASLPALSDLNLTRCDVIDLSPLQSCPNLATLTLYGCPNLQLGEDSPNFAVLVGLMVRGCKVQAHGVDAAVAAAAPLRAAAVASAGADIGALARALGAVEVADAFARGGLDARDGQGNGLLAQAIAWRDPNAAALTKALLAAGVPVVDPAADAFRQPMYVATQRGIDPTIVALLLDAGADPSGDAQWRPVAMAAHDRAMVDTLLARGASVTEPKSFAALCHHGHLDLVERALAAGASAEPTAGIDDVPLVEAAYSGSAEVVRRLLDAGAQIDRTDTSGRTALFVASELAVVDLLLDRGAAIDHRATDGSTPLMQLTFLPGRLVRLAERGADVTAADNNGSTAAHAIADHANSGADALRMLQALVDRGADLRAVDRQGRRPGQVPMRRKEVKTIFTRLEKATKSPKADGNAADPAVPAPLTLLRARIEQTDLVEKERVLAAFLATTIRVEPTEVFAEPALWPAIAIGVERACASDDDRAIYRWINTLGVVSRPAMADPLMPFALIELSKQFDDKGFGDGARSVRSFLYTSDGATVCDAAAHYAMAGPSPFRADCFGVLGRAGTIAHVDALVCGLAEGKKVSVACAKRLVELGAAARPAVEQAAASKKKALRTAAQAVLALLP